MVSIAAVALPLGRSGQLLRVPSWIGPQIPEAAGENGCFCSTIASPATSHCRGNGHTEGQWSSNGWRRNAHWPPLPSSWMPHLLTQGEKTGGGSGNGWFRKHHFPHLNALPLPLAHPLRGTGGASGGDGSKNEEPNLYWHPGTFDAFHWLPPHVGGPSRWQQRSGRGGAMQDSLRA